MLCRKHDHLKVCNGNFFSKAKDLDFAFITEVLIMLTILLFTDSLRENS